MRRITLLLVSTLLLLSQTCQAGFGDLGPYFSFIWGDGGYIPEDVTNIAGQQTSPDGQSVKFFGSLGPIDGARFLNGFVLAWSGLYVDPINAGDTFTVDLEFDVDVIGGDLTWDVYAEMWIGESVRILTDPLPLPASGVAGGIHLVSNPAPIGAPGAQVWGHVHIGWTNYSPTDTFTISIPQDSVDITFVSTIPEPSSLMLLGFGVGAILHRRVPLDLVA